MDSQPCLVVRGSGTEKDEAISDGTDDVQETTVATDNSSTGDGIAARSVSSTIA